MKLREYLLTTTSRRTLAILDLFPNATRVKESRGMTKYWLFALVVHPVRALRALWINRRQRPPAGRLVAVGRSLFQIDFKQHFHPS